MGEIRADCPCPKTKCPRHKDCDACREYHKTMYPYCEREEKGKRKKPQRDRRESK